MKDVLFLGFALPEDEFRHLMATDAGLPTATQRFAWSVIEALTSAALHVTVVSAAPATNSPQIGVCYSHPASSETKRR